MDPTSSLPFLAPPAEGAGAEFPLGPAPGWPRPVPEGRGGSSGRGNWGQAFRELPGARVLVSSRASLVGSGVGVGGGAERRRRSLRSSAARRSPARAPARARPRPRPRSRSRRGAPPGGRLPLTLAQLPAPAEARRRGPSFSPRSFPFARGPSGLQTLGWPWPAT